MTLTVTLYWSFRSPYSYIVLPRIADMARTFDVEIDLRVVHPAAIRNPSIFARMDPIARPYFLKDTARAAAFHGLPFRRPIPDPIVQDQTTLRLAEDHPLARRLGHLGIAATEGGKGLEFAQEVATLLWDGTVTGWNQGSHLADAARRAGLDLEDMDTAIQNAPKAFEAKLTRNDADLRAVGHWGVPTMVFENEAFFGQDRFDVLVWRLTQKGLAVRNGET